MNVSFNSLPLNFISIIKDRVLNLTVQNQKILAISSVVFAIAAAIYVARRCWNTPSNPLVPEVLAKIFKEHSYNPENLPVLDLSDRGNRSSDYITDISPEQMTSPVMRFTDGWGRHGIAVHLKRKSDSTRTVSHHLLKENSPSKKIDEVWTFHQRYLANPNLWVGADYYLAKNFINERHDTTDHIGSPCTSCPNCPIVDVNFFSKSLFESLLTGQDPDLQLGDKPGFNLFAQA